MSSSSEYPEVNVYTEGKWFGPDYPDNGMPKYHTEAIDGPLPEDDYDDERVEANRGQQPAEPNEPAGTQQPNGPQQPSQPDEGGEGGQVGGGGDEDGPDGDQDKIPARKGNGSSKEAWAAYATAHDVDISAAKSRDDIIDACEAAGVPTE